jgi:aminopeptidase C
MLAVRHYQCLAVQHHAEVEPQGVPTLAGLLILPTNQPQLNSTQSYLFFWDKLNKSNYYLELSMELADRPLDDRLVYHLAGDLISDGGQWDMVVNILEVR